MVKWCCAFGCSNKEGRDNVSFYRFPTETVNRRGLESNTERRKWWINAVKRVEISSPLKVWEPSPHDRLCSAHFLSGKKSDDPLSPDFVPSVFSHTSSQQKRKGALAYQNFLRRQQSKKKERRLQRMIMEFIPTTRGGRKLLLDGYTYITDKRRENVTYWRCERKGGCGGRLKTEDDIIQGEVSNHSHPPNAGLNLSLKTVQKIKERARQSEEVTSTIIQNYTSEYPLDAAGALPKKETLARMVRRQRTAPDGDVLTNDSQKTIRGEDFVVHKRKRQPMEDTIEVMVGLQNISSFSEDLIKPECPANTGEMSMNSPDISAISAAVWRPSHETTPLNPPNPSFSTHETPPTPSEIEAKAVLDGPSLQEEYDPLFIIPEVFIKVEDRSDFEPTVIPAVTLMVEESLKPEPDMGTTIKSEID